MSIDREDHLSRCIIYDKNFRGMLHIDQLLFVFPGASEDGACHESLVLRRLAPEDVDVHRVGCGIAERQNKRKNNPAPGAKRKYYCGFRTAQADGIELRTPNFTIKLTLDGEGGEPAHVDIALTVHSDDRSERNRIKGEAGLILAEAFDRPISHICECDAGDQHHPLKVDPDCLTRELKSF